MKNKLIVLVMFVSIMMLLAACGSSNTENTESSSSKGDDNTFTVGMEAGYAPFNWTQLDDSNGGVKIDGNAEYAGGYDVEIAKKIAEGLGKELVIVKTEWDGLVPSLESGIVIQCSYSVSNWVTNI